MPAAFLVILPILGTLLALLLPRRRGLGVGLAGVPLLVIAAGGLMMRALSPGVAWMAAALGLAAGLSILLVRLLPRLVLLVALVLVPGAMVGLCALTNAHLPALAWKITLGLLLVGALAGTVMVRFGLRLFWAIAGGALACGGWWFERPLAWLAATAVLFVVNFFSSRLVEYEDAEWVFTWRLAGAAALAVALGLFAGTLLIPALPAPAAACASEGGPACRLAKLSKEFPAGGIVWPLPSEALTWGSDEFPWVENLDARYLGALTRGPVRLPGSNPLLAKFALNGRIHDMRMIKEPVEVAALRTASRATVESLRAALPLIRAGGSEAAVAAALREGHKKNGCAGDSFPPIVAGGRNALNFHYFANNTAFSAGEGVVIDIGCYADGYASDFTRTLPVDGKFSPSQRKTYTALYNAHQAAAKACKPGIALYGKTDSLNRVARDALKANGAPDDFGHGIGHPLGLFVHDVFERGPLKPGMVIMIEPGVYLEKEGVGMRLEDAYLVTETGCELLTDGFPADPDSIEAMFAPAK